MDATTGFVLNSPYSYATTWTVASHCKRCNFPIVINLNAQPLPIAHWTCDCGPPARPGPKRRRKAADGLPIVEPDTSTAPLFHVETPE